MFTKGQIYEKRLSEKIHSKHRALLVSPLLLRNLGLGQVDMSYLEEGEIIVLEVKYSSSRYLSKNQYQRLKKSSLFIAECTGLNTIFKVSKVAK